MTDPNLLTPENGFVEGCVVEWKTKMSNQLWHAVFVRIEDGGMICYDESGYEEEFHENTITIDSYMTLIRPLTGPMAIWNHITEKVVAICRDDTGWPEYQLYSTHPAITNPTEGDMWRGLKIEHRPFWAKVKP